MLKTKWEKMGTWGPLAALKNAAETKWLIDGVIASGSLNWMVASPESFKTFLAMDMASCVAGGRPWHGRETDGAAVLYLAAEGGNDIHVRRAAADMAAGDTGPLCVVQMRPRLDEQQGLATLLGLVELISGQTPAGLEFPEVAAFRDVTYEAKGYLKPDELAAFNTFRKAAESDRFAGSRANSDCLSVLEPLGFCAENFWFENQHPGYRNIRTRFNAWDEAFAKVMHDAYIEGPSGFYCKNVFLVIDTYSQTSGDDTKPVVSRYIKTLRDLQEKAAAQGGVVTVLVIDHTTKSGDSYMGSLAKEGDSDAMIEVDRPGKGYGVTLKCSKMKMAVSFQPIHLELKPFTLDGFTDALGRPLTSLVVLDGEQSHKVRKAAGADKDTAAATLLGLVTESGTTEGELRQLFTTHQTNAGKKAETVARTFRRAFDGLTTINAIFVDSAGVVCKAQDTETANRTPDTATLT